MVTLLALLGACGGGGATDPFDPPEAPHDLSLTFRYGDDPEVVVGMPLLLVPQITGLEGHQATCTLVPGDELPTGLVLQPGCAIQGTPIEPGAWMVTVELTVAGYTGSLRSGAMGSAYVPALLYPDFHASPDWFGSAYSVGQPMSAAVDHTTTSASLLGGYHLTGDSAMPPGLTLDPATGTLAGTPEVNGDYNVAVVADLTAGPNHYAAYSEPELVKIRGGEMQEMVYPTGLTGQVGQPFSIRPAFQTTRPLSEYVMTVTTQLNVTPDKCRLFPDFGLELDPRTGEIHGTPTMSGHACGYMNATSTRGGQPTYDELAATYDFVVQKRTP